MQRDTLLNRMAVIGNGWNTEFRYYQNDATAAEGGRSRRIVLLVYLVAVDQHGDLSRVAPLPGTEVNTTTAIHACVHGFVYLSLPLCAVYS